MRRPPIRPGRIANLHERRLAADPSIVGALIDGLGSPGDRLWPARRWPAMVFEGPLGPGVAGGHGPVRYTVDAYESSRRIRFRFTRPHGFDGWHEFSVLEEGSGTLLRHTLSMQVTGPARLSWPLVFRPLHDALLEDALDNAGVAVGDPPVSRPRWSLQVRLLRRLGRLLGARR